MRKKCKSYVALALAILFMGITFPELIYTDDTVQVVDEDGEKIMEFSDLPGDVYDHMKELYESGGQGKIIFRFRLLPTREGQ